MIRASASTSPAVAPLRYLAVGEGPALVVLHGFAMQPSTYLPLARLLADRVQVVIPAIFETIGLWSYGHALDCLEATLEERGLNRVSLLGHSFGGGLELGLAARRPELVAECVFADTLGVRERFGLAQEALRDPFGLMALATPRSVSAFFRSTFTHPFHLAAAAMWGFLSDRDPEMDEVVEAGIPCHVLWANHDTLLARSDGRDFALRLGATFTVAAGPRVEHDWMFEDPEVFVEHLEGLGLEVLGGRSLSGRSSRAGRGRDPKPSGSPG